MGEKSSVKFRYFLYQKLVTATQCIVIFHYPPPFLKRGTSFHQLCPSEDCTAVCIFATDSVNENEDWKRELRCGDLVGAQHKQKEKVGPQERDYTRFTSRAKSSSVTLPPDATLTTNRCSCFNERERAFAAGRSSRSQRASWKVSHLIGNENEKRGFSKRGSVIADNGL